MSTEAFGDHFSPSFQSLVTKEENLPQDSKTTFFYGIIGLVIGLLSCVVIIESCFVNVDGSYEANSWTMLDCGLSCGIDAVFLGALLAREISKRQQESQKLFYPTNMHQIIN